MVERYVESNLGPIPSVPEDLVRSSEVSALYTSESNRIMFVTTEVGVSISSKGGNLYELVVNTELKYSLNKDALSESSVADEFELNMVGGKESSFLRLFMYS